MKILLVHGQTHQGTSYHMGRILAEKLCDKEEITEFFLPRDLNHFCLGCYSCLEDEAKCPFWEEKKKIIDAMERSDIFIFTTPNYCLAPSASMVALIDMLFDMWMVHKPKEWMFKKRAVVLSSSAGASCKKALSTVKDSLFYWGVPYIKTYGIPSQAMNWSTTKPPIREKLEQKLDKMASKLKTDKLPHVGIKTKFMFNMMNMLHVKGWDSSPTEKVYWEEKGWLSKARPWKKTK